MPRLFRAIAATLIAFGVPSAAHAILMTESTLTLQIGPWPSFQVAQSPDPVVVSLGIGNAFQQPAVFASNIVQTTAQFATVELVSSMNLTLDPPTVLGTFAPGGGQGGGFGGSSPLNGQVILGLLGGVLNLVVPLGPIGVGGTAKVVPALSLRITVTGAPWTTGAAVVTGITTTTTTPSGAQNLVNTVNLTGFDTRTASGAGSVMLMSPMRFLTTNTPASVGNLRGFAVQVLKFAVPEPGTLLPLGSGVLGLVAAGCKRMRR